MPWINAIHEFFGTEAIFIEKQKGYAHANFDAWLANSAVTPADKDEIQAYLAQWDALKLLYDKLDIPENSSETTVEAFILFFNSPAFQSYSAWMFGMNVWNKRMAEKCEKYGSVLSINSDSTAGPQGNIISITQRPMMQQLLLKEISKIPTLSETEITDMKSISDIFRGRIQTNNRLLDADSSILWNESTEQVIKSIMNTIKSNAALSYFEKIQLSSTLVKMIQGGLYGTENSAERLESARAIVADILPLIQRQIESVTTMEGLVEMTAILQNLNDNIQTPAASRARKSILGGESSQSVTKTIQKQLREYLADDTILQKALSLMETSNETTDKKETYALIVQGLVDTRVIDGVHESKLKFSNEKAKNHVFNDVAEIKKIINIPERLAQYQALIQRLKSDDTKENLALARAVAEVALEDAVDYVKESTEQMDIILPSMREINQSIQSSTLNKALKHFNLASKDSHGDTISIQKRMKVFLSNPTDYAERKPGKAIASATPAPLTPDQLLLAELKKALDARPRETVIAVGAVATGTRPESATTPRILGGMTHGVTVKELRDCFAELRKAGEDTNESHLKPGDS